MNEPRVDLVDPFYATLESIEAIFTNPDCRWPVLRTGERDEIPTIVRRLVRGRDGNRCTLCGSLDELQLDHIVPWSAGGSDASHNLRTLCEPHNRVRSNHREAYLPRVQPVTAVCDPCLTNHRETRLRHANRLFGYCAMCMTGEFAIYDQKFSAWCGTCTATSWTSDPRRLM